MIKIKYICATTHTHCKRLFNSSPIIKNATLTNLSDKFGRKHNYLRISLSERCNLRCQYCMPEEGVKLTPNKELLTSAEIIQISELFVKLGVSKIRFTGGEPLIRQDIVDIINSVSKFRNLKTVALTTNGIHLHRKIKELKDAGLNAVNISLDTMVAVKYKFITRFNGLNNTLKSIHAALEMGFQPLKINCVIMKGINDDEILSFVKLTEFQNLDVRFLEYCPFGGNQWSDAKMVPYAEMLQKIKMVYPDLMRLTDGPNDTSKAYKVPGFVGQIGFITSMTQNFCGSCNRLRITADGSLKVCLFGNEEVSLRDELRCGKSETDLIKIISNAVLSKKKQHAGMSNLPKMQNRPMILIGGLNFPKSAPNFLSAYSITLHRPSIKVLDFCAFYSTTVNGLTHTDDSGKLKMVDVSLKHETTRTAEAEASIYLGPLAFQLLERNQIQKGDVVTVAKIAGVMAAKKTSDLIPLCHNLKIHLVDLAMNMIPDEHIVIIQSKVKTRGETGVEMEALTSVTIAALTVYDMCKAVSKDIEIKHVRLLRKSGGKTNYDRN